MNGNRRSILILAVGIGLALSPAWVEGSKVAFDPEPMRQKTAATQPETIRELSAAPAGPESSAPAKARPAAKEPLRYDALPEQERKRHALDEILGGVAEV